LEKLKELDKVSDHTSEHTVYFDPTQNRAVKRTLPGQFGWLPKLDNGRWTLGIAKPLDYLRRWELFNKVFGDDVRLEGATVSQTPSMVVGDKTEPISVVISQRWHRAADINSPIPTEAQVSTLLHNLGFEPLPNSFHGWRRASDGMIILDARPDNFVKTKDGIAPIDLPLMRVEDENFRLGI
jgi:hypothetical protein